MDEYKGRFVKFGDQDNRRKDRLDRQKEYEKEHFFLINFHSVSILLTIIVRSFEFQCTIPIQVSTHEIAQSFR